MTDFTATKALFDLPKNVTYLDGNSLGPLPRTATDKVSQCMKAEWGQQLITSWKNAGWMEQPRTLGDRIGRLIGAEPGHVVLGDTLSIKVYQALAAALDLAGDRKIVLSDTGNFPTDLYMAEGLLQTRDTGHKLRCVAPEKIADNLSQEIGVLMLTQVDYRTGRLHDMQALTKAAHEQGIICIWDLAHSAGALPVNLADVGADFAVGCTYKYLNGGPGAPAFIYAAPRHTKHLRPALAGWLGHETPFAFDRSYRPGPGIERLRVGTPPVLQMAALSAALDIWDQVDMGDVRRKSIELTQQFIRQVERRCPALRLSSPRDPAQRGSQVSFTHPEGYAIMQALIAQGVIGDFRAPDVLRFGFTPLYIDADDVSDAVDQLVHILDNALWDKPEYKIRGAIT